MESNRGSLLYITATESSPRQPPDGRNLCSTGHRNAMLRRGKNRRIASSRKTPPAGGAIAENCDPQVDDFDGNRRINAGEQGSENRGQGSGVRARRTLAKAGCLWWVVRRESSHSKRRFRSRGGFRGLESEREGWKGGWAVGVKRRQSLLTRCDRSQGAPVNRVRREAHLREHGRNLAGSYAL